MGAGPWTASCASSSSSSRSACRAWRSSTSSAAPRRPLRLHQGPRLRPAGLRPPAVQRARRPAADRPDPHVALGAASACTRPRPSRRRQTAILLTGPLAGDLCFAAACAAAITWRGGPNEHATLQLALFVFALVALARASADLVRAHGHKPAPESGLSRSVAYGRRWPPNRRRSSASTGPARAPTLAGWTSGRSSDPTSSTSASASPSGSRSPCPADRSTASSRPRSPTTTCTPCARRPPARTSASAGSAAPRRS